MTGQLLGIRGLRTSFPTRHGLVRAVDGVDLDVRAGECLGVVGESGSGKSVTFLSVLGLVRPPGRVEAEAILFQGRDLKRLAPAEIRAVRGRDIAITMQDALTALNPAFTVETQIVETIRAHEPGIAAAEARRRAIEMLRLVGIPDADRRLAAYPHQFSGGMRQRVMVAIALACRPKLLIADEPTTALDVTIQAQILRLLEELNRKRNLATILITHDLGVVAEVADRVLVMYAGRVVEQGTLDDIFYDPQHPYTWGLLGSLTRIDRPRNERLAQIAGQPPSLISPPTGCHFRDRCPHVFDRCTTHPRLEQRIAEADHCDRCWLEPEQKGRLRIIAGGEIGLAAPEGVEP